MTTNKLKHVVKKILVTKNNIDELFAYQPSRRKIRATQVKVLVKALEDGNTFPILTVNRTNPNYPDKFVLIDGNHRQEALIDFLAKHPDRKVEILVSIYDLVDEEQERELFRVLNATVTPSSDDMLQQYKDEVEFISKILRDIECVSIYGSKTKPLKMRPLLVAYFDAIKSSWSPAIFGGMDLIHKMEGHPTSGVKLIKEFLRDYQNIFGELTKGSVWMRTTAINVMFRLWYQNKSRISFDEMQERMRKIINHNVVIRDTAIGGREATENFAMNITDVLNRQRKRGRTAYIKFVMTNDELY